MKRTFSKIISSFDKDIIEKEMAELAEKFGLKGRIIDYGCGQMPYAKFFEGSEVVGADIDNPTMPTRASVVISNYKTPLPSSSFDVALCTEVIEHTEEPEKVLLELKRILKKDGYLVLTAPFMIPEHDERDYWRFTLKGLKMFVERHGFAVVYEKKLTKNFHSAGHLAGNAIMSAGSNGKARYITKPLLLIPYFVVRLLMSLMNKLSSLRTGTMVNLIVARKVSK